MNYYLQKTKHFKKDNRYLRYPSQYISGMGFYSEGWHDLIFEKSTNTYTYLKNSTGDIIWSSNTSGHKSIDGLPVGEKYFLVSENKDTSEIKNLAFIWAQGDSSEYPKTHLIQFDNTAKDLSYYFYREKLSGSLVGKDPLSLDVPLYSKKVTNLSYFLSCTKDYSTSRATYNEIKINCENLTNLDYFASYTALNGGVTSFYAPNIESMKYSFYNSVVNNFPMSSLSYLPKLIYAYGTFINDNNASGLTNLPTLINYPKALDCSNMFCGIESTNLPYSIDLPIITETSGMFSLHLSALNFPNRLYMPMCQYASNMFFCATGGSAAFQNGILDDFTVGEPLADCSGMFSNNHYCIFDAYNIYLKLHDVNPSGYNARTFAGCPNSINYLSIPSYWR